MRIVLKTEECGGYVRYLPVKRLGNETREAAEARFADYRAKGVIQAGCFADDCWELSDELQRTTLNFTANEFIFRDKAEKWLGCTVECYKECMKAYIAFQMGRYALSYLRLLVKDFTELAGTAYAEALSLRSDERSQIIGFLSLIPYDNDLRDMVIESLEEQPWKMSAHNPRQLADFKYYLRFDQAVKEYWPPAAPEEKKYYFPVFLWWNLTSILPLRVTEFLTTPRDCLRCSDGRYILTIRRTRLKKGNRKLSYALDADYEKKDYEIPESLYRETDLYLDMTKGDELPALGTLLVPERDAPSGYFTYCQMRSRLRRFCKERIGNKDYPINLGDTRHLAMISLILSGGSPVICRELAGHESIDVSSNYYANLSGVVESVIYEKHHGWYGGTALDGTFRFPLRVPEHRISVQDGWCDVPAVANGDISECLKCYSGTSGIGVCVNCRHFCPDKPGLRFAIEKDMKKAVDEDGIYLMQMIELVRKGLGYSEDIGEALLRLQSSAYQYGSVLSRKFEEER